MKPKKIKSFIDRIYMRDVIAIVVLALLFWCKLAGKDGMIDAMIALVIGYYFSKRVFEERSKK